MNGNDSDLTSTLKQPKWIGSGLLVPIKDCGFSVTLLLPFGRSLNSLHFASSVLQDVEDSKPVTLYAELTNSTDGLLFV